MYVPGYKKKRVREAFEDIKGEYWDKLSPEQQQWMTDEYFKSELNNDLSEIPCITCRRRMDKANRGYHEDIFNKYIRTNGSEEAEWDLPLAEQTRIDVPTKDPSKRKKDCLTREDWIPNYVSGEDALIDALDAGYSFFDDEE